MKDLQIISDKKNYTAVNLGKLQDLCEYGYMHPQLKAEIPGKVFLGGKVKSTGAEVSFQFMPPKTDIPFYHKHKGHEEIYVFLRGQGEFQVDGDIFNVKEGTIVKINPEGKRTWRNNSAEPLIFMVIQVKQGSMDVFETLDGYGVKEKVKW